MLLCSHARTHAHTHTHTLTHTHTATGTIVGFTVAAIIVVLIISVIATVIIFFQIKKRRARRFRFQQLTNTTRATPTTRSETTQQFCPKPDEWYRTIEGHWVQGPPPVYAFDASQENVNPQGGGESFQLELVNEQNVGSGQSTNMTAQPARIASLDQIVSLSPQTVRYLQSH